MPDPLVVPGAPGVPGAEDERSALACPVWGPKWGHNWIVIKGWLPWRRYRVCCACDYEERIV